MSSIPRLPKSSITTQATYYACCFGIRGFSNQQLIQDHGMLFEKKTLIEYTLPEYIIVQVDSSKWIKFNTTDLLGRFHQYQHNGSLEPSTKIICASDSFSHRSLSDAEISSRVGYFGYRFLFPLEMDFMFILNYFSPSKFCGFKM